MRDRLDGKHRDWCHRRRRSAAGTNGGGWVGAPRARLIVLDAADPRSLRAPSDGGPAVLVDPRIDLVRIEVQLRPESSARRDSERAR
jgi:hypothetical protein